MFIAVDNAPGSAGDIYVSEGEETVSKRDSTGALVTTWGSGGHMTFTEELLGIAVDFDGNLWVVSGHLGVQHPQGPEFGRIGTTITGREFEPSGTQLRSWTVPLDRATRGEPAGTTVNSSDVLTVTTASVFTGAIFYVKMFDPTGADLGQVPRGPNGAIAVDPVEDNLYSGNAEGLTIAAEYLPVRA